MKQQIFSPQIVQNKTDFLKLNFIDYNEINYRIKIFKIICLTLRDPIMNLFQRMYEK
jgi:hypothetical protein